MKTLLKLTAVGQLALCVINSGASPAFEGTITATLARGGQPTPLLYTISPNRSRVEVTATDRPYPVDILNRDSGALTLLFPHNRSFVRLQPAVEGVPTGMPGVPGTTLPPGGLPPGIGPRSATGAAATSLPGAPSQPVIGPTNLPGGVVAPTLPNMPAMPYVPSGMPQMTTGAGMPVMPMPPPMMMDRMELKATTDTTNLLGYACTRYELKQRGEVMEIWATDKLLPFQPYLQNQPHRYGPRMIEEQWGELLKAKKLFPLLAILRFETPSLPGHAAPPSGPERMRFEVKSITPEKIQDETLFEPPPDYHEIQPLPF